MSNICFLLSCLMIPLSLGLIDLQSQLSLTSAEHTLFEVLILVVVYWMIWLIIRFDRWLYLRNFSPGKVKLLDQNRITETGGFTSAASFASDRANTKNPGGQVEIFVYNPSSGFAGHGTLATIGKLTSKNGQ